MNKAVQNFLFILCAMIVVEGSVNADSRSGSCQRQVGRNGRICVDPFGVSLRDVVFFDEGTDTASGLSVDIQQDVCDEESGDKEPFYETSLGFTVQNNLNQNLFVVSARHILRDSGGRIKSQKVRFNNPVIPAMTNDTSVKTFFLDISGDRKFLVGRTNRPFSADPGVVRVKTLVILKDDRGQLYRETLTSSVSLGNMNRLQLKKKVT